MLYEMATIYAVRVHQVDGVTDERISEFFGNIQSSYVIARESDSSRVHYQGWLVTEMKDVTIRARLKKAFPECVGNKGYSLKPLRETPEVYMRYCMKGTETQGPVIVCAQGLEWTQDWIAEQHTKFWSDERAKAYGYKKAKMNVTEQIWAEVDEVSKVRPVKVEDVVDIILENWTAVGKPFDTYSVKRLTNTILSKYSVGFRRKFKETILCDYGAFQIHENNPGYNQGVEGFDD